MNKLWAAVFLAIVVAAQAHAEQIRLHAKVGQCEYVSQPGKDEHRTKCAAEAYLVNQTNSELYLCRAEVEGDQYVAPSVGETAPDTVLCTRIGQPFVRSGSFDIEHADDTTKLERTVNRLQGFYSWKNGFWAYSRTNLDVKFCTHRLAEAAPDYRMRCSRQVEWRK